MSCKRKPLGGFLSLMYKLLAVTKSLNDSKLVLVSILSTISYLLIYFLIVLPRTTESRMHIFLRLEKTRVQIHLVPLPFNIMLNQNRLFQQPPCQIFHVQEKFLKRQAKAPIPPSNNTTNIKNFFVLQRHLHRILTIVQSVSPRM